MKILLIEDDPQLRTLVSVAMERAGHIVLTAVNGQAGLDSARRDGPDFVILDIGLPEMDGLEVCRRLRATSSVPILFLTARDDEIDRILGLELGADDYVTKPFSPRELVARVAAIARRYRGVASDRRLSRGRLRLDPGAHACAFGEVSIALTGTEFQILEALVQKSNEMCARPDLIAAVWGARSQVSDRTLDSHLRNLRRKLGEAGCTDAIETVHGVGIRLGACA